MKTNGTGGAQVDLADLAERCRVASNAVEMLPSDSKLLGECAEVFESMENLIKTLPEVVRRNRAHQFYVTCEGVAVALDRLALDYERGTRPPEPPDMALRTFAASLRDSLKPEEERKKPTIIL